MFTIGQNDLTPSGSSHSASIPASRFAYTVRPGRRVSELQETPLVEEDVVVELRRERLPELQGELVERHTLVPQVVGTDDGRVPDGVPVPEPAALQNGHVLDGGGLREGVGRCPP